MTKIATTQNVTVVSSFLVFLTTVERYRQGRQLVLGADGLETLLALYGAFRSSLVTVRLLPGGAKVVASATKALDNLNIPQRLTRGELVQDILIRWYYQFIYPVTQEVPVVAGQRLINPGIR